MNKISDEHCKLMVEPGYGVRPLGQVKTTRIGAILYGHCGTLDNFSLRVNCGTKVNDKCTRDEGTRTPLLGLSTIEEGAGTIS
jgi:hypothetical protein